MAETKIENKQHKSENNKKEYKLELYEQLQQTIPSMWIQSGVEYGENVIIFETGDVSHTKLNMENILKLKDFIEQWIKQETQEIELEQKFSTLVNIFKTENKDKLLNCHDCGALPGQPHEDGCDVERCSVCGEQRLQCDCSGHDKLFARWTGLWPGEAEAEMFGLDMNGFYIKGLHKLFFVKPNK